MSDDISAQYHNLAAAIASPEDDSARFANDFSRNVPMARQPDGSSQTTVSGTLSLEDI